MKESCSIRQKPWFRGAVAGIALSAIVGTSVLAFADDLPLNLPATDAQGNRQVLGEAGKALIKEYEGIELDGYLLGDGMCTIGYGHAVSLNEISKADCKAWHITEAEAEEYLKKDSLKFSEPLNDYFDRSFTQNQFDALMSFSYNTGFAYQKYEWPKDAPDSYFPGVMIQYTNPPQYKEGLTRRRKAEIALFENPQQPAADVVAQPAPQQPTASRFAPANPAANNPTVNTPVETAPTQAPAQVDVPTVTVTQFPEIAPMFSGGFSAR